MLAAVLLLLITILVGATWLFLPYRWTSFAHAKLINKIPGPKPTPFFGNVFQLNVPKEELIPLLMRTWKTYGSVFRFWTLGNKQVFILDPDDVEKILNNRISTAKDYGMIKDWLGTGLLTSSGDKWYSHRKMLTPAFHFKILETSIPVFNANCAVLVEVLRSQFDQPTVDIHKFLTLCTLDIICETAMGVQMNSQREVHNDYVAAVDRIKKISYYRRMSFWLFKKLTFDLSPTGREQKRVIKILHDFTNTVIKRRREEYREKKIASRTDETIPTSRQKLTFLDILIEMAESKGLLTDEEIREEVDTFMFEGHDSTATAITWSIYLLGCHQDIQERVMEEMRDIFGDSDREPEYADLMNMKYLEMVIKESLRLYPSAPILFRKTLVHLRIKDYLIPPGTTVTLSPFMMHRNPEIFPDPDAFDPDNFLPERIEGRHPFAYLPFSAGPRNCIGQKFAMLEEKTLISTILRNFHVTSFDKMANVKPLMQIILMPANELKIKLRPRKHFADGNSQSF